jgi:hypothetical protein
MALCWGWTLIKSILLEGNNSSRWWIAWTTDAFLLKWTLKRWDWVVESNGEGVLCLGKHRILGWRSMPWSLCQKNREDPWALRPYVAFGFWSATFLEENDIFKKTVFFPKFCFCSRYFFGGLELYSQLNLSKTECRKWPAGCDIFQLSATSGRSATLKFLPFW